MLTMSAHEKSEMVNQAVAAGAVYVKSGDGLNTRKVLSARVRHGNLQLETTKGFEYFGNTPFVGSTQRKLW